jgi:hypothetical protein
VAVTPDLVIRISDTEEYRFDPKKFLNVEAIAVEKAANLTWPQVMIGLNNGQMSAVTAIVWLLRKRENPVLQYSDVEFGTDVEVIDPDQDERYAVEAEVPKDSESPAEEN